jgi:hypothetical protein
MFFIPTDPGDIFHIQMIFFLLTEPGDVFDADRAGDNFITDKAK